MVALISLLIIVTLSITVVRIGATALELTGLSHDVASFQAQSAFSGVGFTTSESETIVSHPVRRRIVRVLILVGSAGITTSIATFVLTFVGQSGESVVNRALVLGAGLLVIYILARSNFVYQGMKKFIIKALKNSKSLALHDYQEILGISKGYSIARMVVKKDNWIEGKQLKDLELHKEGTLVLSIHRTNSDQEKFIIPSGETVISSGDVLTLYGRCANAQCLADRQKGTRGDVAHQKRCEMEENFSKIREIEENTEAVTN